MKMALVEFKLCHRYEKEIFAIMHFVTNDVRGDDIRCREGTDSESVPLGGRRNNQMKKRTGHVGQASGGETDASRRRRIVRLPVNSTSSTHSITIKRIELPEDVRRG